MGSRVSGARTAIDALVAAGKIRSEDGAAAKAAIALLPEVVRNNTVYAPGSLSAQDGTLFFDSVPLFSLPSVLPGR